MLEFIAFRHLMVQRDFYNTAIFTQPIVSEIKLHRQVPSTMDSSIKQRNQKNINMHREIDTETRMTA
jgi:hypothetical protein